MMSGAFCQVETAHRCKPRLGKQWLAVSGQLSLPECALSAPACVVWTDTMSGSCGLQAPVVELQDDAQDVVRQVDYAVRPLRLVPRVRTSPGSPGELHVVAQGSRRMMLYDA